VTTRDPPLLSGRDSAEIATDLGVKKSDIFSRGRLENQPEIVQQIAVYAQRYWEPLEGGESLDVVLPARQSWLVARRAD
jgi:hypothetical protein